jgi:UDP-N-acetylglucosamine--dolichyl-phosphate N-acetylglucosaminephosphotransferase
MIAFVLIFAAACLSAGIGLRFMIPQLHKVGMTGKDMNKPHQPEIAEMGGLAIAAGFSAGMVVAIALQTFSKALPNVDLVSLLAAFVTVLAIAIIGIMDDLLSIPQRWKAFLPLIAALPLVAIKAGDTNLIIPFFGQFNIGLLYPLALVPIGIAGAANAVNMLGGFNGLEVGIGIVATSALAFIAFKLGATVSLVLLLAALGALIATLYFNWYPARVFIGDVGTLSIGAIIASAVILGNFELAGVIVIAPYAIDFLLKAKNKFPSLGWWGAYQNSKLYCPDYGPVGLAQLVMKLTGGIGERELVLFLIGLEVLIGLIAIVLFVR